MGGALLMAASMPRAAAGLGVSITAQTFARVGTGSSSTTGSYTLDSDGNVYKHGPALLETWLVSGAAGDYEVMATLQSGSSPTAGTMGSWLALSSDRTWSLTVGAGTEDHTTFLVEIRRASDGMILDSATITINVDNLGSL